MKNLPHYGACRFVAYVEIVTNLVRIFLSMFFYFLSGFGWLIVFKGDFGWSVLSDQVFKIITLVFIAFSIIVFILLLVSAILFIRATSPENPVLTAHKMAIGWQFVIVLAVVAEAVPVIRAFPVKCAMEMILRLAQFCLLQKFKSELETMAKEIHEQAPKQPAAV